MDSANVIVLVTIALFAIAAGARAEAGEAAPAKAPTGRLSFPLHFLNDEQSTIAPIDDSASDEATTTPATDDSDNDFDNALNGDDDNGQQSPLLTPCQANCLESNSKSSNGQLSGTKRECLVDNTCISCWLQCSFTRRLHAQPLRPVRVVAMIKQEFLVATHITWPRVPTLNGCYVTWEVAGGGLVGHLLTDGGHAELSLWPSTKYRVVVVCKDKESGKLVRSPTLFINTANAISMKPDQPTSAEQQPSGVDQSMLPFFNLDNRILKGSSSSDSRQKSQRVSKPIASDDGPIVRPAQIVAGADDHDDQMQQIVFILLAIVAYLIVDAFLWGPCRYACRYACDRCCASPSKSMLIDAEQPQPEDCLAGGRMSAAVNAPDAAKSAIAEQQQFVLYAEER